MALSYKYGYFVECSSLSYDLSRILHDKMLGDIFFMCLPLSLPSLYLSYQLRRRDYLGTVFNQQIALMLLISGAAPVGFYFRLAVTDCFKGVILPFTTSLAVLRAAAEFYPALRDYKAISLEICALQRHLDSTFLDSWLHMGSGSIMFRQNIKRLFQINFCLDFRFVLIKYPDRGLVNGDSKLFVYLFWISNFFFVFSNEANKISLYLSRGESVFANTIR